MGHPKVFHLSNLSESGLFTRLRKLRSSANALLTNNRLGSNEHTSLFRQWPMLQNFFWLNLGHNRRHLSQKLKVQVNYAEDNGRGSAVNRVLDGSNYPGQ
jgi:hypothetical protein